jgi:TPR repeat protein
MYYQGQGVQQDYKEAMRWYDLAADEGDADAQLNLGIMYEKGQGVLQDDKEAAKWYRLAVEQGNAAAQINLGAMYVSGQGVPQDYIQAHVWFNLAGAGGNAAGIKCRDLVAGQMTPAQIAEAQRLAREWKPRAGSAR